MSHCPPDIVWLYASYCLSVCQVMSVCLTGNVQLSAIHCLSVCLILSGCLPAILWLSASYFMAVCQVMSVYLPGNFQLSASHCLAVCQLMSGCLPSIVWLSVLIGKNYSINLHPSPIEFPLRRWTDMKYQSKIATYRLNRPRGRFGENMSHFVATSILHPRKHLTKSIHPPPIKVPPRRWIDIKYQTNIATYRLNRPRGRFSESMSNFVAT